MENNLCTCGKSGSSIYCNGVCGLTEVSPPISDFIISQKDIKPQASNNGAYYHYSDVCTLLNRFIMKEKEGGCKHTWRAEPKPRECAKCGYIESIEPPLAKEYSMNEIVMGESKVTNVEERLPEKTVLKMIEAAYRKGVRDGHVGNKPSPFLITSQVQSIEIYRHHLKNVK